MRCRICGRPPTEECCPICHEVAGRLEADHRENKRRQAANFGHDVNTEEANQ